MVGKVFLNKFRKWFWNAYPLSTHCIASLSIVISYCILPNNSRYISFLLVIYEKKTFFFIDELCYYTWEFFWWHHYFEHFEFFSTTTSFKYLNWQVMAELPIVYCSSKTCQNESDFSQSFDPSNRNWNVRISNYKEVETNV